MSSLLPLNRSSFAVFAPPAPAAGGGGGGGDGDGDGDADDAAAPQRAEDGFGGKHIGLLGSICLLANNITGPAMIQIPVMYQTAGWFVPTLFFAFIGLQAGFSGIFLSKAVSQMPGNRRLRERMEFSNMAKLLFPKWRVAQGRKPRAARKRARRVAATVRAASDKPRAAACKHACTHSCRRGQHLPRRSRSTRRAHRRAPRPPLALRLSVADTPLLPAHPAAPLRAGSTC